MKKQEYLNKVSEIYDTLVFTIESYDDGHLGIKYVQALVRKCWEETPKDFCLIDDELAESLELDRKLVGEVVRNDEICGWDDFEVYKEFVEGMIEDIPNWEKGSHGKLSVYGSNSIIPNIIGEPEWNYFRFSRR